MKNVDTQKVESLVGLFDTHPSRNLVRNLDVRMSTFSFDGLTVPLSLNQKYIRGNCYICCPTTAFIDYAKAETRNFSKIPLLKNLLVGLISCCTPLVRATGLDMQVQVNNWLLSTNPVPTLTATHVQGMISLLTKLHPKSAIILRSLNSHTDADTMRELAAQGFKFLASRQVYIFQHLAETGNYRRTVQRDLRMRSKNGYTIVNHNEFTDADFIRSEQLYNMLYLEKHSTLNPHYTAEYLKELNHRNIVSFSGVRNAKGILDAVSGIFENGNITTQPFVGYDTTKPQDHGLYRIAMSFGIEHALVNGLIYNMSSGAASFKRNRGALPSIEYIAVYNRHLSFKKRVATHIMQKILNTIGIPLLRRFEL